MSQPTMRSRSSQFVLGVAAALTLAVVIIGVPLLLAALGGDPLPRPRRIVVEPARRSAAQGRHRHVVHPAPRHRRMAGLGQLRVVDRGRDRRAPARSGRGPPARARRSAALGGRPHHRRRADHHGTRSGLRVAARAGRRGRGHDARSVAGRGSGRRPARRRCIRTRHWPVRMRARRPRHRTRIWCTRSTKVTTSAASPNDSAGPSAARPRSPITTTSRTRI